MSTDHRSLDEIGRHFGTDKSSWGHGYLARYEPHFAGLRDKQARILEIGVAEGGSLATWEEYFPNAKIVGVDIHQNALQFARERVAIEIADQSNVEELTRLAVAHGPFDIVIEDGSHLWEHQITSLRTLFPFVSPGGMYVVEDLQINYPKHAARYRGNASISCMEYLHKLVDLQVAHREFDISAVEDAFLRTYGNYIDSITFIKHACLLRKGYLPTRSEREREHDGPLFVTPEESLVRVQGHVGWLGDTPGQTSWVSTGVSDLRRNLQGFALFAAAEVEGALHYRARLANQSWTDWVSPPSFVGSRGAGLDLTGLEVRLQGEAAAKYSLGVACKFRGSDDVVTGGNAEPCFSATPGARLCAMQVHLAPRH